jgi:3-hydroxyacyl-CoA dehydrogenase/3-hydroxy-2-methylbutyryl-CoA dehydrogenase
LSHQYDTYLQLASDISADAAMSVINPDFNEKVIAFSEMDVTSEDSIETALDLCENTFGEPVNVVINCAGTAMAQRILSIKQRKEDNQVSSTDASDAPTPARVHSSEDFMQSILVNTVGTFNMCRLGARRIASRPPLDPNDPDALRGCIGM